MKRLLIMLGLVAALFSVACGGGVTTPDDDGTLLIIQEEFKFSPSKFELKAGQKVRLVLRNDGDKDHEFMIGRNVADPDGFPNGFEHDFFEGIEVTKISGPGMIMGAGMEMDEDAMAMDKDKDAMAMDKDEDAMAMDKDKDAMAMDKGRRRRSRAGARLHGHARAFNGGHYHRIHRSGRQGGQLGVRLL